LPSVVGVLHSTGGLCPIDSRSREVVKPDQTLKSRELDVLESASSAAMPDLLRLDETVMVSTMAEEETP
jgi:hypothetical protein